MPSFRRPSLILHATVQYVAEPMLRLETHKQMPDATVCGVRSCCLRQTDQHPMNAMSQSRPVLHIHGTLRLIARRPAIGSRLSA